MNKTDIHEERELINLLDDLSPVSAQQLAYIKTYELLLDKDYGARMEAKKPRPYNPERFYNNVLLFGDTKDVLRFINYSNLLATTQTDTDAFEADYAPMDRAICSKLQGLMLAQLERIKQTKEAELFLPKAFKDAQEHIRQPHC